MFGMALAGSGSNNTKPVELQIMAPPAHLFSVHFLSRNPKQLCTTVTNIVATVISMRSQSLGEPCQTQAKFQSSSKGRPNGNFTQNSCSREKKQPHHGFL
jgi:hypothetical protein